MGRIYFNKDDYYSPCHSPAKPLILFSDSV